LWTPSGSGGYRCFVAWEIFFPRWSGGR
jgi:hypothetical protein